MRAFDIPAVLEERAKASRAYREFLRVPALSAGVYALAAGAADPQEPHAEDEVYLVLAGRATFESGGAAIPVGPGTFLYVPAREAHRFVEIEEDLSLLVLFAPAESGS